MQQHTILGNIHYFTANYELRVDECFFEAKDQQTGVTASSLQLLDVLTQ